jgi:hypothetical protein
MESVEKNRNKNKQGTFFVYFYKFCKAKLALRKCIRTHVLQEEYLHESTRCDIMAITCALERTVIRFKSRRIVLLEKTAILLQK